MPGQKMHGELGEDQSIQEKVIFVDLKESVHCLLIVTEHQSGQKPLHSL